MGQSKLKAILDHQSPDRLTLRAVIPIVRMLVPSAQPKYCSQKAIVSSCSRKSEDLPHTALNPVSRSPAQLTMLLKDHRFLSN